MGSSQVHIRLDEEQKERWQEAVDNDPRFSSLSDFIRYSVEEQIQSQE
jgi:Arc/MetJ-type ribon-helix-helix transcriptional regulator